MEVRLTVIFGGGESRVLGAPGCAMFEGDSGHGYEKSV